jgi:hypothetical protein
MRKQLLVLGLACCPFSRRAAPNSNWGFSFVQQIASSGIVRDFQQKGDGTFAASANASRGMAQKDSTRSNVTRMERRLTRARLVVVRVDGMTVRAATSQTFLGVSGQRHRSGMLGVLGQGHHEWSW